MFSKRSLDVVSAGFTARSIFSEMATGDRSRVAKISLIILQINDSGPNC